MKKIKAILGVVRGALSLAAAIALTTKNTEDDKLIRKAESILVVLQEFLPGYWFEDPADEQAPESRV